MGRGFRNTKLGQLLKYFSLGCASSKIFQLLPSFGTVKSTPMTVEYILVLGYARMCKDVLGYARLYQDLLGYTGNCLDVVGYTRMC